MTFPAATKHAQRPDEWAQMQLRQGYNPPAPEYTKIAGIVLLGITIVVCFALQSNTTLVAGTGACILYLIFQRQFIRLDKRAVTNVALATIFFAPAFFKPNHGFSPVFYLLATFVSMGTAFAISRLSVQIIYKAMNWLFWICAAMIGFVLYTYWGYPEPFGEVIEGASTNGIPAYLIVVQITLSLACYVARGRLPLLSPIVTGLVAFYGSGRGSIVVASLIIVGTLLLNAVPRNMALRYRLLFLLISALALGALIVNFDALFDYVSRFSKISVGLVDGNREEILQSYLDTITPYTFFMGSEYDGTLIDFIYMGNPHISFIRTHSFFGVFPTVMAIASPLLALFYGNDFRLKIVFFYFLALAVVRAASEPILFPTLLDVFYFLPIFMFFMMRRENGIGQ